MDNLKLTNDNSEFLKDNLKVVFLANIAEINLIVGPNNSRKSRFLRHLISQEQNVVLNADTDLNNIYWDIVKYVEAVKVEFGTTISDPIFQLTNEIVNIDKKYLAISKYFQSKVSPVNQLSFFDIITDVNNIREELIEVNNKTVFEALLQKIKLFESVIQIVLLVYTNVNSNNGIDIKSNSNGNRIFPFDYRLPGIINQTAKPNLIRKIHFLRELATILIELGKLNCEINKDNNLYIPALRTSRTLTGIGKKDVFADTLLSQHIELKDKKAVIDTGLNLYEKILLARNGKIAENKSFREFEIFIGKAFFRSENISIVAHKTKDSAEDHIIVSLPNELDDVPIYNLGDGVQGIINLLFPIFMAKNGTWVIIDEPENHLHPGYQNIFIKAITENEFLRRKKLRYFVSTHSNHILTECLISPSLTEIFVFSRNDSTSSNIQSIRGNEQSTLEMLGVLNTSVLVSNCSIWCEGITDRMYLKSFLKAFINSKPSKLLLFEGLNYSFIEYAGKNLVHYTFDAGFDTADDSIKSYFINANVFLLADSDNDRKKHLPYRKIKSKNFEYHETVFPEIENIIPDDILKSFLIERLKCDSTSVKKCFPITDHSKKLGEYFEGQLRKYGKKFTVMATYGGTLKPAYKRQLAEYVFNLIQADKITWNELKSSSNLKRIIEALYKFIESKNKL